ncbi:MAG TPA: NAD-dependent epimerase/dehydratase family protein [Candidatus Methylomirabilis sp.]|nr:NAD-dependent epimerase/dehydratase family protein [Candidatus Methylomirabilis sp.]
MACFVTGCAGFIGSTLVDRLLQDGREVVGYDNFSTGQLEFLAEALPSPRFTLVRGDALDGDALARAMRGAEIVFHLAANADVRHGTRHPRRDLDQNTVATVNVLEAMQVNGVRRIAFASTGSIYGEPAVFPTSEDAPFPVQTSLYAASKLAAEGFIEAYCEGFGFQAFIFRFVSILGERYSHGHVFDFYRQLRANPGRLDVLGDGRQRKSYLYVQDCVDAMLLAAASAAEPVNIFNLGTDEHCRVDDSIGWICEHLGVSPERVYSGGARGWVGDSPFIFLDCARVRALGWKPTLGIREGVIRTLEYLEGNPWLLERRA